MKHSLQPGLIYLYHFTVPPCKTVPALCPHADEFQISAISQIIRSKQWQ